MNKHDVVLLVAYSDWANDRVLGSVDHLTTQEFVADSAFETGSGGIRATLVHQLDAERGWRFKAQHGTSPADLDPHDYPDAATLSGAWRAERDEWQRWLAALGDAALEAPYSYERRAGGVRHFAKLWHTLMQVVNHGTQHRSEVAAMLTMAGTSPGDSDFGSFVAERSAGR